VNHPERVEDILDRLWRKARHAFRGPDCGPAYAGAVGGDGGGEEVFDDGLDFADLRRRFDDLERRAESMEEYVSSEEHSLDREFHRMRDEDRG